MITVEYTHEHRPPAPERLSPAREPAASLRAPWLVILAAFVVAAVALGRHATGYFFLYDDFALVESGLSLTLDQMMHQAVIGFYRPMGFVLFRTSAWLFAWDLPGGHAAVALLLHAINSLLCFGLVRALGLDRLTAALAALLLLLSPWATEAFLWLSAIFDLLATAGVLATLLCVRLLVSGPPRTRPIQIALAAGIVVFATIAFFAKESASVLPALAVIWIVAGAERQARSDTPDTPETPGTQGPHETQDAETTRTMTPIAAAATAAARNWRRALIALICIAAPAVLYAVMRIKVMALLGGAYGSYGDLLAQSNVAQNVWSYARALILPPLPGDWSMPTMLFYASCVCPFFAVIVPAVLWRGFTRRPGLLIGCVLSFLICVAPVAWTGRLPDNTTAGRFEYLPGVWFAIAAACVFGTLVRPLLVGGAAHTRRHVAVAAAALAIACGYYTGSLVYQVALWGRAAALSRSVVQQMEAYRGSDRALYVTNLPGVTAEGPFVLKPYAFRYYRARHDMPPVRADMVLIRLAGGPSVVMPLGEDPMSDYKASAGRPERAVTLRLE